MADIAEYLRYLEERNLSQNTIQVYGRNLNEFWEYTGRRISIGRITRSHIRGFLCYLAEKNNQPITRRLKQTTLRNFFGYLEDEGMIKFNPTKNVPILRVPAKEPQYLTNQEIKKIISVVRKDKSRFRKRNELMTVILAETGIRLSELISLDIIDINTKEKTIKVKRKGNMEQSIPINSRLNRMLKNHIGNKTPREPLLVSSYGKRITARRVGLLFQEYVKMAGISKLHISAHSLRHGFCVRLLEQRVDIKTIQVLAGHKSIETTAGYLHIAKKRLRKEIAKVQI